MCFTIPRKVIKFEDGLVTVENRDQSVEEVRTLIKVMVGDYVLIENSVIIEKIKKDKVDEIFQILEQ